MKTFVEFLLDQKIVSAEGLAHALNEQVKQMKNAAEVVFEQRLLPFDQYVRVLVTQSQSGESFQYACEAHGVWSNDFAAKVRTACESSCPSLGDILLTQGQMTRAQLESAGQSFHMRQDAPVNPSLVPTPSQTVNGLSVLLQEQILPKLEPFVRMGPWSQTQLKVCYHLLHQLVGIARFANAPTLEELAMKTELVFATASASVNVGHETLALCSAQIGLLVAVLRESVSAAPVASSSLDSFFDNLKTLEQRLQPSAA